MYGSIGSKEETSRLVDESGEIYQDSEEVTNTVGSEGTPGGGSFTSKWLSTVGVAALVLLSGAIMYGGATGKASNVRVMTTSSLLRDAISTNLSKVTSFSKYTVTGSNVQDWVKILNFYVSGPLGSSWLGCDNQIKGVADIENGAFSIHFVDSPILEQTVETQKSTYWQQKVIDRLGSMDAFNSLMHNKIQLLLPDLSAIDAHIRSPESQTMFPSLSVMRRLSTTTEVSGDVLQVAHLTLNVVGFMYELVAPVSAALNTDGYVAWAPEECPAAHQLHPDAVAELMKVKDGSFSTLLSGGGFQSPAASSIHINTAAENFMQSAVIEDLQTFAGNTLIVQSDDYDYCTVTTVSGFAIPGQPETVMGEDYEHTRTLKFIRNTADADTLKLTEQWEQAISDAHQDLLNPVTEHWGSNWDHWLDQHIGLSTSLDTCDSSTGMSTIMDDYLQFEKNRPTGLRIDSASKYYVGYPLVQTMEYYAAFPCGDSVSWLQASCACMHSNNMGYLEKVTGDSGCPNLLT